MKKTLITLTAITLIGCGFEKVKPIELIKGKGYVVIENHELGNKDRNIILKNSDSIFSVRLHRFDAENLKIGDTIK